MGSLLSRGAVHHGNDRDRGADVQEKEDDLRRGVDAAPEWAREREQENDDRDHDPDQGRP